jgi:comEA protein
MNTKKQKTINIFWKICKNVHFRIICFWVAGIAGLWTTLILTDDKSQPPFAVVAQVLQEEQEIYFDDKMPVFTENQEIKAEKEVKEAAKTSKTVKKGSKLVNINTAGIDDFSTLPGIGPATAQKIIDYRKENGNFGKIEDIKKVKGIGEKKFEAIKDFLKL